jgi:hypothetical protein
MQYYILEFLLLIVIAAGYWNPAAAIFIMFQKKMLKEVFKPEGKE